MSKLEKYFFWTLGLLFTELLMSRWGVWRNNKSICRECIKNDYNLKKVSSVSCNQIFYSLVQKTQYHKMPHSLYHSLSWRVRVHSCTLCTRVKPELVTQERKIHNLFFLKHAFEGSKTTTIHFRRPFKVSEPVQHQMILFPSCELTRPLPVSLVIRFNVLLWINHNGCFISFNINIRPSQGRRKAFNSLELLSRIMSELNVSSGVWLWEGLTSFLMYRISWHHKAYLLWHFRKISKGKNVYLHIKKLMELP